MIHSLKSSAILSIGLLGSGGSVYGAQPQDVVQTDLSGNTAVGSGVLKLNLGTWNTAAGRCRAGC
jgi:hypothetical protein